MVSKIAEFNELIKRNAERNGFRFADPTSRFLGHELCGEDERVVLRRAQRRQVPPDRAPASRR